MNRFTKHLGAYLDPIFKKDEKMEKENVAKLLEFYLGPDHGDKLDRGDKVDRLEKVSRYL